MEVDVKFHKEVELPETGFRYTITKEVPKTGGVYFFIRDGIVYYVGRTINLLHRLTQHVHSGILDDADSIALHFEDDIPKQYVIEAVAIAEYLPELNIRGKTK